MKLASQQSQGTTLAAMFRAMDRQHPVTITYTKADGSQTVRTIELHDVRTTQAGAVILRAADRESGEMRTFRVDRIDAYTVHRTTYTVALPEGEQPARALPAPTSPAALIAYELGRDERPVARHLAPAA